MRNYNQPQTSIFKVCFIATFTTVLVTLNGCDSAQENYEAASDQSNYSETTESVEQGPLNPLADSQSETRLKQQEQEKLVVENLGDSSELTLSSQTSDLEIAGKQLLVNASANFKVDDVVATRNKIETLTRQYKGYIASSAIQSLVVSSQTFSQQSKNIDLVTYYRQANMQLRIPKPKVSNFLNQLQSQIKFLEYQEFTAQDVTLDLYREKLQAQLNSEMAEELTQQRLDSNNEKEQASNVDSIRATYSAKQRQQLAEIEKMMIADQVKYSTIQLTFTQPNSIYKEITDSTDYMLTTERPGFWEQARQSIIEGWQVIKDIILGIISLWWLWALGGLLFLLYLIIRKLMINFDKRKVVSNSNTIKSSNTTNKTVNTNIIDNEDRGDPRI